MRKLDYSSFSRFCYCTFKGQYDPLSPDYYLWKHCYQMSYDELNEFYGQFAETVKYIKNLDTFLYLLKWLTQGLSKDLTRAVVLEQIMGNYDMIKDECVDELFSHYSDDIDIFLCDILNGRAWDDRLSWSDEEDPLPF